MGEHSLKRQMWLQLFLGLAAAALAGVLLKAFWELFGLPDRPGIAFWQELARPWGLKNFVYIGLPTAAFLPTLVLSLMIAMLPNQREAGMRELCRQCQRLDAYTYLFMAAGVVLVLVWNILGNGFLALGLVYLGMITAKALILTRLLWLGFLRPQARGGPGLAPRRLSAAFLVILVIFSLPAIWVNQSVSASGGEAVYLVQVHDMVKGKAGPGGAAEPGKEHRDFYWQAVPRTGTETPGGEVLSLTAYIYTPAYAVAGRLGVLLLLAVFMSLSGTALLAWLEQCGLPPKQAAAGTGLTLTSAPVYCAASQALPEPLALFLFTCGLLILSLLRRSPWGLLLLLALASLFLSALDLRFAPLSVGLLLLGLFQVMSLSLGRIWAWCLVAAAAIAVAVLLAAPWVHLPAEVTDQIQLHQSWWRQALHWWTPLAVLGASISLDQSYGVILAAPVFLLALGGLPLSLVRRPRPSLQVLVPVLMYLAVLCFMGWHRLPNELAAPGSLVAVFLPSLALFMAPVLVPLTRPWWRLGVGVPAALGLIYTWLLTLLPWMRMGQPGTPNPMARAASLELSMDVAGFLPAGLGPSPVLAIALAVAGGLVVLYFLASLLPWPESDSPWRANEALALALSLAVMLTGLVAAAAQTTAWY